MCSIGKTPRASDHAIVRRFCVFWAINGILQGFGGPCCARILTSWFATKERGTYWGMWNIAHNLGGFMAPIVCGKSLVLCPRSCSAKVYRLRSTHAASQHLRAFCKRWTTRSG